MCGNSPRLASFPPTMRGTLSASQSDTFIDTGWPNAVSGTYVSCFDICSKYSSHSEIKYNELNLNSYLCVSLPCNFWNFPRNKCCWKPCRLQIQDEYWQCDIMVTLLIDNASLFFNDASESQAAFQSFFYLSLYILCLCNRRSLNICALTQQISHKEKCVKQIQLHTILTLLANPLGWGAIVDRCSTWCEKQTDDEQCKYAERERET